MATFLAITPEPGVATVVVTGVSLVFMILVVLALIITAQGKIFDAIAAAKKAKADAAKAAQAAAKKPAAPAAPAAPAPAVEDGIPAEIVAVIAAAIACMTGGKYQLRAVRRADRSRWSAAGVENDTMPF